MPNHLPSPDRRRLLGLFASLPLLGRAGSALAAPPPSALPPAEPVKLADPMMLVPGPNGGAIDRWARLVQPALAQSAAPGTVFQQEIVGGADGVTAANQFEARGTLDGLTLLMAPGQAALAWLVGDPRAKFDVSRWVAVAAGIAPAVLVGLPDALSSGRPVRIAASGLNGPDLPAILGIELLGARAEPVAISDAEAARHGFAGRQIDAALLRGHRVPEQIKAMAAIGARPLFALGIPADSGQFLPAQNLPTIPTLRALYRARRGVDAQGPLFAAWSAAAIAAQLEFGLVLPELTPAPMVALWRQAGVQAMASLDIQALAAALSVQPVSGPAATACGDLWSPRAPALLALRQWLAERYNWRPS